jgi:hypothetical protein
MAQFPHSELQNWKLEVDILEPKREIMKLHAADTPKSLGQSESIVFYLEISRMGGVNSNLFPTF